MWQGGGRVSTTLSRSFPAADATLPRLIAQAEHLAETHLQESDPMLDLAERETAFVVALDHDFDTIAVAAGFAKQTIATLAKDPGA